VPLLSLLLVGTNKYPVTEIILKAIFDNVDISFLDIPEFDAVVLVDLDDALCDNVLRPELIRELL